MRRNLPVSGREIPLAADAIIVSMTDQRGMIGSINRDFIDISGFTEAELVGTPHNIVRHPDMPPAAFADMWASLRTGRPWTGMVKNRCKNGDHYWVEANATPCYEGERLTGYMSVRRKPSPQQVAAAEKAYAAINAGAPLAVLHGAVVSTRPWARFKRALGLGLKGRLWLAQAGGLVVALAGLGAAGLASPARVGAALGLFAVLGAASHAVARHFERRIARIADALRAMRGGDYAARIDTSRDDTLGRLAQAAKSVQVRLGFDLQQLKLDNEENLRIRTALEQSPTRILLADGEHRVTFVSQALLAFFRQAEAVAHAAGDSDFHADAVVGNRLGYVFGAALAERRLAQVQALRAPCQERYAFGPLTLELHLTPLLDQEGARAGTMLEWRDVTAEQQAQHELGEVVQAAAAGDFGQRIPTAGKAGFYLDSAEQLNRLLDSATAGLDQVSRLLAALAEGDLTYRIQGDFRGVFERMREDAGAATARLTDIVGRIQRAAAAIGSAAAEISAGNDDLSRHTEQQAANLEETAASMEELTATVRANAEHARQADATAQDAGQAVRDTSRAISEVVQVMNRINESSRRIADIIGVIDGIAFQTNILALNAAVEAARAGEQGRGFAVVAAEVRALAQRSATAAREIKDLIVESGQRVEAGLAITRESERDMAQLVEGVQRTTGLVNEIAAASAGQAAGIEQVSQTVGQMDETTRQNAALVEEAAVAARALEEQARRLDQAVSVFRVEVSASVTPASGGGAV